MGINTWYNDGGGGGGGGGDCDYDYQKLLVTMPCDGFVSGILAAAAVEMHILWPVF
jgi:hypothetical protein